MPLHRSRMGHTPGRVTCSSAGKLGRIWPWLPFQPPPWTPEIGAPGAAF